MAKKSRSSTLASVLRILSAARATMTPEEQRTLDSLIIWKEGDEVEAHQMTTRSQSQSQSQSQGQSQGQSQSQSQPIRILFSDETGEYMIA
jgi:hypothetical protein